jgi:type I restriction enzyme S subunit
MNAQRNTALPKGWAPACVGDILLPTSTIDPARQAIGEFIYVDIDAIDNERQCIRIPKRLANSVAPSRARNKLAAGDVVFSLVRPYLKNIAIIPPDLDGAVGSTAFFVCRPGPGIDSRFLLNFMRRDSFIASVKTYGNSPPAAHDDEFMELLINVAPSSEQSRISDILDELLSDLDAGVAAIELVRAKLPRFRASVVKAAVEGTLTTSWRLQHPYPEPDAHRFKRILDDRRRCWEEERLRTFSEKGREPSKNWKAKYKEPIEADTIGLTPLPDGWHWVSLDQVLWKLRSGTAKTSGREITEYPVLKSSAVRHCSIDLNDVNYLGKAQSTRPENFLQLGDLLITRLSGSIDYVGCCAVVTALPSQRTQYPDRIFCGKLVPEVDGAFLSYAIQHPRVRATLEQAAKSTAGHQRISKSDLSPLSLPLPPLAEQEAIIEAVADQLSVIDHLEADMCNELRSAESLRQAILHYAFLGRLVPQEPSDEPASELLKRIAKEREERARSGNATKRADKQSSGRCRRQKPNTFKTVRDRSR